MFRPVPKKLLLPWIAGQIGVALPLFALAQWWWGVLSRSVFFTPPSRIADWSQALEPFGGVDIPLLSQPLFWVQWAVAWVVGFGWLEKDQRRSGRKGLWHLPGTVVVFGVFAAPLLVSLSLLLFGHPSRLLLPLALLAMCLTLQPALLLLYIAKYHLHDGAGFARRWAAPLIGVAVLAGVSVALPLAYSTLPPTSRLGLLVSWVGVNARNAEGDTLLHDRTRAEDEASMRLLLARGADPNARNGRGESPLFLTPPFDRAYAPPTWRTLDLLLRAGADMNAQNNRGETLLHQAAERDNLALAEALLARGAAPSLRNREGRTPLHLAVRQRNAALTTALMQRGADPDAPDLHGDTPARYARRTYNRPLMEAVGAEAP
jgi:FOG: Ankyrin repeat